MKASEKPNAPIFKTKETIGGMWIRNNAQWTRVSFSTYNSFLIVVIKIKIDLLHYTQAIKSLLFIKTFFLSANLVASNIQENEKAKIGTAGKDFFLWFSR